MNRYFISFFISLSLYVLFGFSIFYLYSNNKIEILEKPKNLQIISLNQIELKPQVNKVVEEQKIEKHIQEKEIIKKEEPIIKKKIAEIKKPIVQKEIKKKVEKKQIEKNMETKKESKDETQKFTKKDNVKEETIQKDIQIPKVDEKKVYLDKHLVQIRNLINKNVHYPTRARKLSIEGIVIAKFKINKDGTIENVTILEGHKFLQTATIEAIQEASKSFPKTNESIEIQIPVEYKLI
jgi:periplasmic protein TonB